MVVCLGGVMLAQSIGLMNSPAHSQSPYDNPAVQNALRQLSLPARAAPIGNQFQVNSYTTSDQGYPAVALDSNGDFVVVWQSNLGSGTDTSNSIQGQRYNSAGTPQGSQFQVNTYTTDNQFSPAVAMDSDGDFIVIWVSYGSSGTDTSSWSIQGQRYNSFGAPQGSQFQVNNYTTSLQSSPAVALDSEGDFVVVWESNGSNGPDSDSSSIQGQRYNNAGTPQDSQFQVNSYTTNNQNFPAIALDSDGDFVVVWRSYGSSSDPGNNSIQGQRYNSAGTPQGSQFQVNSYTTGDQTHPAVSLDSDGNFVVVWTSNGSSGSDTNFYSIQGQRYNSTGTFQGAQFQVNSYTTSDQHYPAVALDSDGDFAVVWRSNGSSGSDTNFYSIQGQHYNSAGTLLGTQFQVNSYTTYSQSHPAIAIDSEGNFVIVWQSAGSSGGDTDSSIQGQRFSTLGEFLYLPAVISDSSP
jgi:hypothetical protein